MICKRNSINLNGYKYCCVFLTIQLNIVHTFIYKWTIKQLCFNCLSVILFLNELERIRLLTSIAIVSTQMLSIIAV